jgi:hypothetical protein
MISLQILKQNFDHQLITFADLNLYVVNFTHNLLRDFDVVFAKLVLR